MNPGAPRPPRPSRPPPPAASGNGGRALLDLLRARDRRLRASAADQHGAAEADGAARGGDGAACGGDGDGDGGDGRNAPDEESMQLETELLSRLDALAASLRRRGLFPNAARAREVRARAAERSAASRANDADRNGTGSKKRKRPKGGGGAGGPSAAAYGIRLDPRSGDGGHARAGATGQAGEEVDEGLIVTALCRILGAAAGRKTSAAEGGGGDARARGASYGLTCAALDVLAALCHHAKDGNASSSDSTCAAVEGDMIGSVAVPLLDALCDVVLRLYYNDSPEAVRGLAGCFKACASIVSLAETRLSRADKTVGSLRDAAWTVLHRLPNLTGTREERGDVRKAAAALLAALPLAGNGEGAPPSQLWSQSVAEGVTLLRWAVDGFFPVDDGAQGRDAKAEAQRHPALWKEHGAWLSVAREAPSNDEALDLAIDPTDRHRSRALRNRVECLTGYIRSLLTMEGYPLHPRGLSSSTLDLPLDALLDAAEALLSFPLAAEAKHRSTKSRLRSTPVKDGMISPNAAVEIAPDLRACGHDLLDVTVASCRGGAGARSRARRLVGIVAANLQSSCSAAVVSTVDGGRGGASTTGPRLRGSIPLRTRSVASFREAMLSLGGGVMASAGTAKSVARALVLVGGCLLEQASGGGPNDGEGDEWGTPGERARLAETAAGALAAGLAAFGGLIPADVRSTLDAIVHACLSALHSHGSGRSVVAHAHVKRSLLRLGTDCACVPWGDGGRSSVAEVLRIVAAALRYDPDASVASAALSTLCALDALATPRAPPLLIPARGAVEGGAGSKGSVTAVSLLQGMAEAKAEVAASRGAKEDKKAKKAGSNNKKARREEVTEAAEGPPEMANDGAKNAVAVNAQQEASVASGRSSGNADNAESEQTDIPETGNGDNSAVAKANAAPTPRPPKDGSRSSAAVAANSTGDADVKDEEMAVESTPDPRGSVENAPVEGDEDEGMKEGSDDDSSSSSLDDFPDIVDEEPDEEDRM